MTKKQKAAIAAAVLAILTALGGAGSSLSTANSSGERVRALEVRDGDFKERLDRIEQKLDRLIERK